MKSKSVDATAEALKLAMWHAEAEVEFARVKLQKLQIAYEEAGRSWAQYVRTHQGRS